MLPADRQRCDPRSSSCAAAAPTAQRWSACGLRVAAACLASPSTPGHRPGTRHRRQTQPAKATTPAPATSRGGHERRQRDRIPAPRMGGPATLAQSRQAGLSGEPCGAAVRASCPRRPWLWQLRCRRRHQHRPGRPQTGGSGTTAAGSRRGRGCRTRRRCHGSRGRSTCRC